MCSPIEPAEASGFHRGSHPILQVYAFVLIYFSWTGPLGRDNGTLLPKTMCLTAEGHRFC